MRNLVFVNWLILAYMGFTWTASQVPVQARDTPEVPRIDSVVISSPQPQATDEAVIWYDDFDGPVKAYTESQGPLDDTQAFGGEGRSMLSLYEKGTRGTGNRKVFFGDSPTGRVVRKGQSFDDIYWRVYVKHQHGWTGGGPAKLSRATSIASPRWSQAMIAHVWSSGEALTLDPATGVRGDQVVTSRYNDFPNLDNFVISTQPIGPVVCPRNPVLIKTRYHGPGSMESWQVEVASADQDESVVWRSQPLTASERVEVNAVTGTFVGPLANKSQLDAGGVYWFRVRQSSNTGQTSDWSPWHQSIKTE